MRHYISDQVCDYAFKPVRDSLLNHSSSFLLNFLISFYFSSSIIKRLFVRKSVSSTGSFFEYVPTSPHNFSDMDVKDLTCPISLDIPEDDAVVIANDPARQVYSKSALFTYLKTAPKNREGKFLNLLTWNPPFSKKDIIPAPKRVLDQIEKALEEDKTFIKNNACNLF